MNNYYTYAYLREDGTPYYIGKGINGRAYSTNRRITIPKDKSRILFLKQNLTEEEAFKHEIYMIAIYGRKDLGTGILWNFTDGGEGISGLIHSEETRRKLSEANKGKTLSEEHKRKISESHSGKTLSEDHKGKISDSGIGKNHSEETRKKMSKAHKGKTLSEETKRKMCESSKGRTLSEDHKRKMSEKFKTLIWITDGVSNRRISKLELIPSGFIRGRTTKNKLQ